MAISETTFAVVKFHANLSLVEQ